MDGWVGGWVEAKAGLRIAYSNQKSIPKKILNWGYGVSRGEGFPTQKQETGRNL